MGPGGEFAGGSGVVGRTLDLLDAIGAQPGATLTRLARAIGLPRSTAHRLVAPLVSRRHVVVLDRGRYFPGPAALRLGARITPRDLLVDAARGPVARLARRCRAHAHLGLFEDGMVTYAVRRAYGHDWLFSREGAQLEAYSSAIGKAILTQLDAPARERYLTLGAFVALTARTMTDPAALRDEIAAVRRRGWSSEAGETLPGLCCIAIPLAWEGVAPAALSVSFRGEDIVPQQRRDHVAALHEAAAAIAARLGGGSVAASRADRP